MAEAVLDGLPPFRPRLPWWGPDLQTIRSVVVKSRALDGHTGERLYFPLGDGSGDRLAAMLNRAKSAKKLPLIVLVHGLTGLEDSFYMCESAGHFLSRNFSVLRLNLRGAGRSRPYCRTQYHAGSSDDLVRFFASLPADLTANGVVAVGYSLGANLLLKYLGEQGNAAKLVAAAVVSAPLDLATTSRRLNAWRNTAYQRYLLRYMKAEAVAPGAELSAAERRAVLGARSVWEFDDVYSAPRAGFGGAADYYARTSSGRFLAGVTVPTLVVHALDDPWVPSEPYRSFDWRSHPNLHDALTSRGGHVGFHGGDVAAWHDLAIGRFFESLSRS
ncbi:MAG TPA: alpha/beta fold hydrolase [Stellaceae bacterium]|nr:alpha/beta fold hydrolase [Stellaceae bacterium]